MDHWIPCTAYHRLVCESLRPHCCFLLVSMLVQFLRFQGAKGHCALVMAVPSRSEDRCFSVSGEHGNLHRPLTFSKPRSKGLIPCYVTIDHYQLPITMNYQYQPPYCLGFPGTKSREYSPVDFNGELGFCVAGGMGSVKSHSLLETKSCSPATSSLPIEN